MPSTPTGHVSQVRREFAVKFGRAFVLFGIFALTSIAAAQSGSKRLAVVNGEVITEAEVNKLAAADLAKLDANKPKPEAAYAKAKLEILWKALNSIIEDKLIAAEAARNSMTKDQLLNAEIESNIDIPSDEQVAAFYEANKAQIPLPRDQALPQVKQYLINQQRKSYRDPLIYRLKKQFGVTTYLDPLRTDVATAGYPSRGPAAAPVTIVEFADFECPHCGALYPTLKLVEKNYPDKVRVVYRQFPLTSIHPHAQKAAEAALCAKDQQHFWEFHDSLFEHQDALTIDDLKRRAVNLKLDTTAFNTCLDSGKQADAVKKDITEGSEAGVTGTPGVFINGRFMSGNQPYADIREIIEDELQRAKK